MALQTTGPISLAEIATEFNDTAPHSMSEFYSATTGIPTSGTIDVSDFYGAVNAYPPTVGTLDTTSYGGSGTNAGLYNNFFALGYDPNTDKFVFTNNDSGTASRSRAITINQNNSITFHTVNTISAIEYRMTDIVYDTGINKLVSITRNRPPDNSNSPRAYVRVITVNTDSSLSLGTATDLNGVDVMAYVSMGFDPTVNRSLAVYTDAISPRELYAHVIQANSNNAITSHTRYDLGWDSSNVLDCGYNPTYDRMYIFAWGSGTTYRYRVRAANLSATTATFGSWVDGALSTQFTNLGWTTSNVTIDPSGSTYIFGQTSTSSYDIVYMAVYGTGPTVSAVTTLPSHAVSGWYATSPAVTWDNNTGKILVAQVRRAYSPSRWIIEILEYKPNGNTNLTFIRRTTIASGNFNTRWPQIAAFNAGGGKALCIVKEYNSTAGSLTFAYVPGNE